MDRNTLEESRTLDILQKTNDTVTYVVDKSGAGTHKTIEEAMADAAKNPNRHTMVRIVPHDTIENFERPSEP